jgi:hypothetical protein
MVKNEEELNVISQIKDTVNTLTTKMKDIKECDKCHALVHETIEFTKKDFFLRPKRVSWCVNCVEEYNKKVREKKAR